VSVDAESSTPAPEESQRNRFPIGCEPAPWVRVVRESSSAPATKDAIKKPVDAVRLIRKRSESELVEVFYLIALDALNQPIACSEVTRGILNSSLVHPREVFRLAILLGAAGIIVAHNHPSGNPTPSADDRAITRQLVESGQILDIPVCDHVIVCSDSYFSFAEAGLL
jgi:DNA repair protein RadC